jgi:hypothetical protein
MKQTPRRSVLVAILAALGPLAPAMAQEPAESGTSAPAGDVPAATQKPPMKINKPIRMHEPMATPMAKPGTMKEDMHEGMMQKDAAMKEMMEKEEQDMK